jgi:hypothetical protein
MLVKSKSPEAVPADPRDDMSVLQPGTFASAFFSLPAPSSAITACILWLCLLTYLCFLFPPRPDDRCYVASIIDKQHNISSIKAPRVILVGGSNVALGFDSAYLEKQLQRPVLNMGITYGLGLRFMLEQLRPFVQSGDLIVVIPEYEHFYGSLNGDSLLLTTLVAAPQMAVYARPENFPALAKACPQQLKDKGVFYCKRSGKFWKSLCKILPLESPAPFLPIYSTANQRFSFSKRGDYEAHLDLPGYAGIDGKIPVPADVPFDGEACSQINSFTTFARSHGAKVVFSYPPLPSTCFERNRGALLGHEKHLRKLLNCEILGTQELFSFPPGLFFDTAYHVRRQGRAERSQLLANLISELIRHSFDQRRISENGKLSCQNPGQRPR